MTSKTSLAAFPLAGLGGMRGGCEPAATSGPVTCDCGPPKGSCGAGCTPSGGVGSAGGTKEAASVLCGDCPGDEALEFASTSESDDEGGSVSGVLPNAPSLVVASGSVVAAPPDAPSCGGTHGSGCDDSGLLLAGLTELWGA